MREILVIAILIRYHSFLYDNRIIFILSCYLTPVSSAVVTLNINCFLGNNYLVLVQLLLTDSVCFFFVSDVFFCRHHL